MRWSPLCADMGKPDGERPYGCKRGSVPQDDARQLRSAFPEEYVECGEGETEHEGEDGIGFSRKEEDCFVDVPVQGGEPRRFTDRVHVEVAVFQGMDDEEAEEGKAPQGVDYLNAVVFWWHGGRPDEDAYLYGRRLANLSFCFALYDGGGAMAGELALPGGIASRCGACQDGVHARNSI